MKEVKHYISDDGKKESTNLNDIIEYESIQNIRNNCYRYRYLSRFSDASKPKQGSVDDF